MILLRTFPRQIAYPFRRTCKDKEEFYRVFNSVNGLKAKIYYSVYKCNEEGMFDETNINLISFDIDSKDAISVLKRINKVCEKEDLKRTFIFSTGGFWAYILAKNGSGLKSPKYALRLAQIDIAKKAKLTFNKKNEKGVVDPHINDIDYHIIGDTARVARLPGSYDMTRELFCIPISIEDINKGLDHIKEIAKTQQFKFYVYGNERLDMKNYDIEAPRCEDVEVPDDIEYRYNSKGIPPCVLGWLTKKEKAVYRARFFATVWMKEKGFPKKLIRELAKKYWERYPRTDGLKNNYRHWLKVKVMDYVYNRDLVFPKCEALYLEGLCDGKCKYFGTANLYFDRRYENGTQ